MKDVLQQLKTIASQKKDNVVAVADSTKQLNYVDMLDQVEYLQQLLIDADVQVLALHAQNSVNWILIDLACQAANIVCIPLPAFFSTAQIKHCIESAAIDTIVTDEPELFNEAGKQSLPLLNDSGYFSNLFVFRINHAVAIKANFPKGTQKITFTSGSTGEPKGVCLSTEHQWQVAESLAEVVKIPNPRHLCLLPLSTLLENIAGVYGPLLCGGAIHVYDDAHRGISGSSQLDIPRLLSHISQLKPDSLILIPQLLSVLVTVCQHGWAAPYSLKFIAVGGGKVSSQLIKQARSLGLPVYQGYGLSECGSVVALNTAESEQDLDSVGCVLTHCHIAIEDNELIVHGSSFLGYMNDPVSWYPEQVATGDIGYKIDQSLFVEGRKKHVLISSYGRNISPEWVEAELMAASLFSQCLVVGEAQPYLSLLYSTADNVSDQQVNQWLSKVNLTLPDYARIQASIRLANNKWTPYLTANGRIKRHQAIQAFEQEIAYCYREMPHSINQ